jgi:hypothetical protein
MIDHDMYRSQRMVGIAAELETMGVELAYEVTRLGPRTWGITDTSRTTAMSWPRSSRTSARPGSHLGAPSGA